MQGQGLGPLLLVAGFAALAARHLEGEQGSTARQQGSLFERCSGHACWMSCQGLYLATAGGGGGAQPGRARVSRAPRLADTQELHVRLTTRAASLGAGSRGRWPLPRPSLRVAHAPNPPQAKTAHHWSPPTPRKA